MIRFQECVSYTSANDFSEARAAVKALRSPVPAPSGRSDRMWNRCNSSSSISMSSYWLNSGQNSSVNRILPIRNSGTCAYIRPRRPWSEKCSLLHVVSSRGACHLGVDAAEPRRSYLTRPAFSLSAAAS